jgi:uncharacterized protein (DUF1697 family)
MRYVALLRGINVSGNNKVDMRELKAVFEDAGMRAVRTYINSGNVVFEAPDAEDRAALAARLAGAIRDRFGFEVPVLLRSLDQVRAALAPLPDDWANGDAMKCDVVFLADGLTAEDVLAQVPPRPGVDTAIAAPGALIWKVDRANATRNGLLKLVGTPLYQQVTVRNCNTARKLLALMAE